MSQGCGDASATHVAVTYDQQLIQVVANIKVGERRVQHLEIRVVHVLEDEARSLGMRVAHHIQQLDDVGSAAEVLQYLDLAAATHIVSARPRAHACRKTHRLIFFFLTGFRIFTTQRSFVTRLMPSNTSLYLPRPILRITA